MNIRYLLIIIFLLSSGCSFAPLHSSKTASTVGDGEHGIFFGAPYGIDYNYGLSENLDIGLAVEQQFQPVYSTYLKYSLKNDPKGHSFALIGGAFKGNGDENSFGDDTEISGGYFGAVYSKRLRKVEFNLSARYNRVKWENQGVDANNNDYMDIFFDNLSDTEFDYYQLNPGINIHFTARTYMSISLLCFVTDGGGSCSGPLMGYGINF